MFMLTLPLRDFQSVYLVETIDEVMEALGVEVG